MSNQPVSCHRPLGLLFLSLLCGLLALGVAGAASALDEHGAALDALESKADAAEGKLDALEGKADALEIKLDELNVDVSEIQETVELIELTTIDNACLANERKPSLYLPPPAGGQLPTVRQRAIQVINAVTLSGETTNNAMSKITLADFYLNMQMWKKAYSTYCQALCLAVSLPGEAPRCSAPPF